jgi:hypothetical protein
MRGIVVAVVTFVVMLALAILFVYPAVFGFFQGLFDNHDIGTVIGLVACAMITGIVLSISFLLAAIAGGLADR